MRTRWVRRGIATSVVVFAATLALAAVGPTGLDVSPSVRAIFSMPGMGGSGNVTLSNTSPMAATITSIVPDGSCPGGVTATALGGLPLTVGPGSSAQLVGACSSTTVYGIRRCQQHVMQGPTTASSFTVLCITQSALTLTGSATVALPDAQVNTLGTPLAIMVTNPGGNPSLFGLAIQVEDQEGDFTIHEPCPTNGLGCDVTGIAIPPGATFTINASCSPRSIGAHSAPMHLVGSAGQAGTITLTCNGTAGGSQPALTSDKTTVTLSQGVNAGVLTSNIHISNTGGADLAVSSINVSPNPDWDYTTSCMGGCTITPGSAFDITAEFDPAALGASDATLTITSNDPVNPMFEISLDGTGLGAILAPDVSLGSPPMLDLGDVPIGFTLQRPFVLRNDGNTLLDPVTLTTSGVFGVTPTPSTIPAAGTTQFQATCTPTAPQPSMATIDVEASTAIAGSPLSIAVRCRGTTGSFYAAPSSIDLGEVRVGEPVTEMIELRSVGPTIDLQTQPALATSNAAMSVTAAAPTSFSMTTPATFSLAIDPSTDTDLANSISVTADGSTIQIPVTGRVVTPAVEAPAALMLGSFCVGQPTSSSVTALVATGTASIHLPTQPVMELMSMSPFQVSYASPVAYPYQLPAGASATVELQPLRQATAGTKTDDLLWATDAPQHAELRTTVSAEFIADGGAIAPQFVDFGNVAIRQAAPTRAIRIQNCGVDPIQLSSLTISPGGEFRDDSPGPLPSTLTQNQTATITVGFVPQRIGSRMAVLTVDSSKGPLNVTLSGNGLDDGGSQDEVRSFYACDCTTSDPAAAWPALIVLLVLRRRRRRA